MLLAPKSPTQPFSVKFCTCFTVFPNKRSEKKGQIVFNRFRALNLRGKKQKVLCSLKIRLVLHCHFYIKL